MSGCLVQARMLLEAEPENLQGPTEAPTINVAFPEGIAAMLSCHGSVHNATQGTQASDKSVPVEDECSRYRHERARERLQREKDDCVTH